MTRRAQPPLILQITDKPRPGGGIRRVVDQQQAMLIARGWRCTTLRLVHPGDEMPTPAELPVNEVACALRPAAGLLAALERAAHGVDLIHLHLGFSAVSTGFVTQAARRAPLVVSLHDISPFVALNLPQARACAPATPRAVLARLYHRAGHRALWRRICSEASMILAPSTYLGEVAQRAGAAPERLRAMPHAIGNDSGQSGADVPPPPSACPPVVVYAGLLSRDKGAPLLLEAFARLQVPEARLVFLGDGPAREGLERRARAAGLAGRVSFHGQVGGGAVQRAFGRARVVAHPSLVPEGLGLVGIEAMAQGRPVVGFGLGGARDWLIDGETGIIATRQDAAGLAHALAQLLGDPALADRLGAAARRHVYKDFTAPKVENALIAALEAALASERTRA